MKKANRVMQVYSIVLFLSVSLFFWEDGDAGGISTNFAEVIVPNLSVGKEYAIGQRIGQKLRVKNRGDSSIGLRMEVMVPAETELKEGYEPIPDISWIELERDYFSVEPSNFAETDVIVTVPSDKRYLGKKFQAHVWSHTAGTGKLPIALGLKSRLLLEIREKERDLSEEFGGRFDFSIFPEKVVLENIELGKAYDIQKVFRRVLKIRNCSDYPQIYKIDTISARRAGILIENGYRDCPEPSFLTIDRPELELKAKGKAKIRFHLNFPRKEEYAGGKYIFVIRVRLFDKGLLVNRYLKVYVNEAK